MGHSIFMGDDSNLKKLETLAKLGEPIPAARDNYLKSVIEFLKWTTTFAFGAIIWVSTNFRNVLVSATFLQLSIFFLVCAIIVSMFIIYSAVFHWGATWNTPLHLFYLFAEKLSDDSDRELEEEETLSSEIVEARFYNKTWVKKFIPTNPYRFNLFLLIHLSLLWFCCVVGTLWKNGIAVASRDF